MTGVDLKLGVSRCEIVGDGTPRSLGSIEWRGTYPKTGDLATNCCELLGRGALSRMRRRAIKGILWSPVQIVRYLFEMVQFFFMPSFYFIFSLSCVFRTAGPCFKRGSVADREVCLTGYHALPGLGNVEGVMPNLLRSASGLQR